MCVSFVSNNYDEFCSNTKNIGLILSFRGELSVKVNSINNKNRFNVTID